MNVRTLDLDAATPAGAVDGCPVEVTSGALRLTKQRTIAVKVRCPNGCSGELTLETGDVSRSATVNGTATVRFKLSRKQVKAVRRTATFTRTSPWLTVSAKKYRLQR